MNKLFLVCLFAFVAVSYGMQMTSSENLRRQILALLQTNDGQTVKSVYDLLMAFNQTMHDLRDQENARWAEAEPILLKKIADEQAELDKQNAHCNAIQGTIDAQTKERDAYQKNQEESLAKIEANNENVKQREEQRCQVTLLYLSKVRKSNNAIELLQYLRNEMAKDSFKDVIANQPSSFLTLKEVVNHKHENSLGELYKLHFMVVLAQADPLTNSEMDATFNVNARTSEEIGTGHVDNTRGSLSLDDYAHQDQEVGDYITKVLAFIDTLIADFQNDLKTIEEAEAAAVQAYLDFRTRIERENHVLTLFANQCAQRVTELTEVIAHNNKIHDQCVALIPKYEAELKAAQDNYAAEKEKHETKIRNLESTFPIISQAIEMYVETVKSAGNQYHARVEDYTNDKTFDVTAESTATGSVAHAEAFKEQGTIGSMF